MKYATGRHGGPKRRMLYCDKEVTKLFWTDIISFEHGSNTSVTDKLLTVDVDHVISLSHVLELQAGADIDPETHTAALELAAKGGMHAAATMLRAREAAAAAEGKTLSKKTSSWRDVFSSHDKEKEILFGTAITRKNAKPDEMHLCISIITSERYAHFTPL